MYVNIYRTKGLTLTMKKDERVKKASITVYKVCITGFVVVREVFIWKLNVPIVALPAGRVKSQAEIEF